MVWIFIRIFRNVGRCLKVFFLFFFDDLRIRINRRLFGLRNSWFWIVFISMLWLCLWSAVLKLIIRLNNSFIRILSCFIFLFFFLGSLIFWWSLWAWFYCALFLIILLLTFWLRLIGFFIFLTSLYFLFNLSHILFRTFKWRHCIWGICLLVNWHYLSFLILIWTLSKGIGILCCLSLILWVFLSFVRGLLLLIDEFFFRLLIGFWFKSTLFLFLFGLSWNCLTLSFYFFIFLLIFIALLLRIQLFCIVCFYLFLNLIYFGLHVSLCFFFIFIKLFSIFSLLPSLICTHRLNLRRLVGFICISILNLKVN